VDLGIPFLPGMNALLARAVPRYKLEEMELTGARLTAADCLAHHIVSLTAPGKDLLAETLDWARGWRKNRSAVAEIKGRLVKEIVRVLDVEDPPYIESGIYHIPPD
jgi:enoyl-CoA hydratase/carnithine racemase